MICKMEDIVRIARESVHMPRGLGNKKLDENSESWAPYLRFLGAVVSYYRPKTVLELGVYVGTATVHMALSSSGTKVIGVDKEHHSDVWNNVYGYENITLILGDSTEVNTRQKVAEALPGTEMVKSLIDLIFLDSTHDGDTPTTEFLIYSPMFADECLVVCDDILDPRMKDFWEWLPGEKQELHFLHPRLWDYESEPGFGVSIVRRQHA